MKPKTSKKAVSSLRKKLTKVFNEYIRLRDKGLPCISCGKRIGTQAGHYLPVSLCPQPSIQFNDHNVNGQCALCNCWHHGAQHDYAKGLIKKYGNHIIEELDMLRSVKQNPWGRFEYEVMIKLYTEKVKHEKAKQNGVLDGAGVLGDKRVIG